MVTTIEIGGGPFVFSAAHAGLHNGQFEPLHGHTFSTTLRLTGELDETGMLTDFHLVKRALTEVLAPLRRRTLMPGNAPGVTCLIEDGQMFIECGTKRYSLPAEDVALLPLANTTTEAIATHVLDQLVPYLRDEPGLTGLELFLAEAPDTGARVAADIASLCLPPQVEAVL
ncbi:6-pyruvoyl tetrahydropterin synthase family protein [Spirillospora sp. NPDC048911]|uniref:6-pyruvoyl trahydropterin synthase family protein n=1 Tax=Spirillospora sp. NPDC048911 TaxID=3364527 RepID=UPI0037107D64